MDNLSPQDCETIFKLAARIVGSQNDGKHRRDVLVTNVQRRMYATGTTSLAAYLSFVDKNPKEYANLVSALTIHTTSWFREKAHFDDLKLRLLDRLDDFKYKKFSLLSGACSSGEEIYSFALVLESIRQEHPYFDYELVGRDIDPVCVSYAKRCLYKIEGLKDIPLEFRKFLLKGNGRSAGLFTLSPDIRARCKFQVKSLVEPATEVTQHFNQVVCRNVLIYFSSEDIQSILNNLLTQLTEDGWLVLGHSETIDPKKLNLQSLGNSTYTRGLSAGSNQESSLSKHRVLVVDDSPTVQKLLVKLIGDVGIEVDSVGSADEASDYLAKRSVDLITLDLHMPGVDGARWLSMQRRDGMKVPVVVISDAHPNEAVQVLGALSNGAQDYISKSKLQKSRKAFVEMLTTLIEAHKNKASVATPKLNKRKKAKKLIRPDVILCGASTGGTEALSQLLREMPADCPPIVVVQHIPGEFASAFAERLAATAKLKCAESKDSAVLEPGCIYLAHGDYHIGIRQRAGNLYLTTSDSPAINRHRPSVDFLFQSASVITSIKVLAVLMTGMGYDGAKGIFELDNHGSMTFVQDEDSCVVYGMPREAIRMGAQSTVGNPREIREYINTALSVRK